MQRLESLDALRGLDMLFIMGGATLITAIASYFPESAFWQTIAEQMTHAEWDGLRPVSSTQLTLPTKRIV